MNNIRITRWMSLCVHYLLSIKRNPGQLFEIFFESSFHVLYFGFLTHYIQKSNLTLFSITIGVLVTIVFSNIFHRIIVENVSQFVDDVQAKNLQHIFIAPIPVQDIALASIVASYVKLLCSFAVVLILLAVLFPEFFSTLGMCSFVWFGSLLLFSSSISLFMSGFILLYREKVSYVLYVLSAFFELFACVVYPRAIIPAFLRWLSYILPPSYIFESIRLNITTGAVDFVGLSIGVISSLLYGIMGLLFLNWSFQRARVIGSLTKI